GRLWLIWGSCAGKLVNNRTVFLKTSKYILNPSAHTKRVQRKYESETGESMEKPGKKLKKLFIILGTTGAVYAGLKYLLPLVAPFFAGYVLALLLRPSARFLAYRLRIRFRGRCVRAPIGAVGGAQ